MVLTGTGGGAGADSLEGELGADTAVYAASGAGVTVRLIAGVGERGDAEGDTLSGDAGNYSLYGGPGDDTFVFAPGNGNDAVMDFGRDADRIDLTAFDLNNINDFTMTADDEGVTIDLSSQGGGTVLLADVTDVPQAADFLI